MAADAIVTDSGAMHIAGVPIVNPSTVVVWEVTPGPGNGFEATPKTTINNVVPPSVNPPNWSGFAPPSSLFVRLARILHIRGKTGEKALV